MVIIPFIIQTEMQKDYLRDRLKRSTVVMQKIMLTDKPRSEMGLGITTEIGKMTTNTATIKKENTRRISTKKERKITNKKRGKISSHGRKKIPAIFYVKF